MRILFVFIIMVFLCPVGHATLDFKTYGIAGISLTGVLDLPLIKKTLGDVETYRKDTQSNICYYSKNKEIVVVFFNDNMGRGFIMRRPIEVDKKRCGLTSEEDMHIKGIRIGDTYNEYLKEVNIPIALKTLNRVEHVYAESAQLSKTNAKNIYKESFQEMEWAEYIELIKYAGEVVDVQADFKDSLLVEVFMSYSIQF
jgi:hypothetical protein